MVRAGDGGVPLTEDLALDVAEHLVETGRMIPPDEWVEEASAEATRRRLAEGLM